MPPNEVKVLPSRLHEKPPTPLTSHVVRGHTTVCAIAGPKAGVPPTLCASVVVVPERRSPNPA
ncbi:hypothetical protein ACFXKR_34440 [Streptomyces violascens]|uniref:hypothetical protein n=1 Tax=Streptomyces violascens TaxID=67381 RepID=UPI0036A01FDF